MSHVKRLNWFERMVKVFLKEAYNHQELKVLLEDAQAQDLIEQDAVTMMKGVLNVAENRVRDVMIPKIQVRYVDEEDPIEKILNDMLDSSHSRYPVLSADTDEVVGILLAKDVLKAVVKNKLNNHADLKALYRPPEMVSESKRLNVLLQDFKKSRNHMALVVDEYGELAGLVTIEDVLEQIVGDIEDEHSTQVENIQKHISGGYLVEAIVSVDDFNRFFGASLESELETIGGMLLQELGRIPQENEEFKFDRFSFKVNKAESRRVDSFIVQETTKEPVSSE